MRGDKRGALWAAGALKSSLEERVPPPQASALMLQEPSPESPLPFGRYQLIRRIGAGGMGEVFLAREDGETPRAVVVKKVLQSLIANRAFVGRFLDESKVVVHLNHPNIARVYAMGEVSGEYFLTMEYVQGKTVSRFTRRLRDKKLEFPLGLVLLLGERVCAGLQYAHEAKDGSGNRLHLVHRDLSPANVCISYRGEVKIIDFGAAQSTLKEEQTAPRVVIGNLTYMAPEQAKKQIVDGRADVYSCGVLLWELLSWHALPQKGDPIERWRKAAQPSWDPPSKNQPTVPTDVDAAILKALQREPGNRYASAAEFGEVLKSLRLRYAPTVTEADLGALLENAFSKEKATEDAVLQEAVYGRSSHTKKTDVLAQLPVVPPTALAFEHTAIMPSQQAAPPEEQSTTDPGLDEPPTLKAVKSLSPQLLSEQPRAPERVAKREERPQRTSFGITYSELDEVEPVLLREIDGTNEADGLGESDSSAERKKTTLLLLSIFVLATLLGFLVVTLVFK